MANPTLIAVFAAVGLTSAVAAQSPPVVDPPLFRYMPGGRTTGFPFGYPNRSVVRYQEIHDHLAGSARMITGVALRRAADTTMVPGFTAKVSMRLSTAPHPAARIAPAFASNTGADVATVRTTRTLKFPADTPATPLPEFTYTIPTDRPFSFGGGGPLCVEFVVETHDNKVPFVFDLFQAGLAHVATIGDACGGTKLATTLSATKIRHDSSGLPADAPLLFLAGVPLPQAWDLTGLGAPGCSNLTSFPVILPFFADQTGAHFVEFDPTPARPGDYYSCQVMAIKPGINALGAVLTEANLVLPIAARSAGRLWAEDLKASTGTAQPVFSLVLGIR